MASVVTQDEAEADLSNRLQDDVRAIRKDCQTLEDWQSQLITSLRLSGWSLGMLLYLPAPVPLHWMLLLNHEGLRMQDEASVTASEAYRICGNDRRLWMALACKTLQSRGWSPTMIGHAWDTAKTNVYRFLNTEITPDDNRRTEGHAAAGNQRSPAIAG